MSEPSSRWQHQHQVREPQNKAAAASYRPTEDDMRDRIAAALYHARPSFRIDKRLADAWVFYGRTLPSLQVHNLEFADNLLIALDHLGLEIVDRNRE